MPVRVYSDTNEFDDHIYVFEITQQQSNPIMIFTSSRKEREPGEYMGVHVWIHKG